MYPHLKLTNRWHDSEWLFFFPFPKPFYIFVLIVLILDFFKSSYITNTVEVSCIRVPVMMLFANAESNNNNLTLFEHLLCARHCSEYCICISSFNFHTNLMMKTVLPSPVYGRGK